MSDGCGLAVTAEPVAATPTFVVEGGETVGNEPIPGVLNEEDIFDVPEEDVPPPAITQEIREFLADFDTATRVLSEGASLQKRPDAISFDYLTSFSIGPVSLGDASQGSNNRVWRARAVNDTVLGTGQLLVSRANDANTEWEAEVVLFGYVGFVSEMDLAFEQAGRAVVALEIANSIWLYWFDPILGDFILQNFGEGRNPRCLLDNPNDPSDSDVMVFYFSDI